MDIVEEIQMMNAKSIDTPLDPNAKLLRNQGEPNLESDRYRRLVGKLNCLTITHPDISAITMISQFLN